MPRPKCLPSGSKHSTCLNPPRSPALAAPPHTPGRQIQPATKHLSSNSSINTPHRQPRPAPQTLKSGTNSRALAPSHQIILSRPGQSSQPSGLGTLHSQEHEQELQHNYNRRVHATYTGDIPRAPDSDEQGWWCHWAPQDTFYIRPLLQN